jgi:hypothetical protein
MEKVIEDAATVDRIHKAGFAGFTKTQEQAMIHVLVLGKGGGKRIAAAMLAVGKYKHSTWENMQTVVLTPSDDASMGMWQIFKKFKPEKELNVRFLDDDWGPFHPERNTQIICASPSVHEISA